MKACTDKTGTDKKRQIIWFAALWCGGIAAASLLAYLVRWVITSTT